MQTELGYYVPALRGGKAFVPNDPGKIAGFEILITEVEKCSNALARLDTLITRLSDPYLLTENLIFMEAVTSSRIEGTKASFEDLFSTSPISNAEDILEVKNCADAFRDGERILTQAKSVMEVAQELHKILMRNHQTVVGGELKKSQNYTLKQDGSIFAYTPPNHLEQTLSMFENFTMKEDELPELIRQAISHWIFEQIHPFPDGNGRVGRILIPLILKYKGYVHTPFALISEAVEKQKNDYIKQFEQLHETGDWIPWCRFFLSVMFLNADKNITRITNLESLRLDYRERIADKAKNSFLHKIVQDLFARPRFTRKELSTVYGLSSRGASLIVRELIDRQIIRPVPGLTLKRDVLFEAHEILKTVIE
jgi:Fic family protein